MASVVLNLKKKATFSSSAFLFALSDCLMNTCQQFLHIGAGFFGLFFFPPSGGLLELIVFKGGNQMFRKLAGPDSLISLSYSIISRRRVISMSFPPPPPAHLTFKTLTKTKL